MEIEQLEEQLNTLKQQLEEKKRAEALAALNPHMTLAEKVEAFERLRTQCLEYATAVIGGDYNDDYDHYIYESVMQETLGKNVFNILNKYF